jgi:hypothetical protein
VPRTAAAVLMGLTALATAATGGSATGCSDSVETDGGGGEGGFQSAAAYGVAVTSGGGMDGSGGAGGGGGVGGGVGGGMAPAYGVPETDNDKDGYTFPSSDCDDNNANIHPGAPETPGDNIDSNCDGKDDT